MGMGINRLLWKGTGMFLYTMGMEWEWEYGHGNGREWNRKSHYRTSLILKLLSCESDIVFLFSGLKVV